MGKQNRKTEKKPSSRPESRLLMHGKLPPQAIDMEISVLGSLMLDKSAINNVIDMLAPECFYKDPHQKIYNAICQLFAASQPIDILSVTQQLRQNGDLDYAGGAYYITQLTNRVASSANIEFHARIILQKFVQRELILISDETTQFAYEETSDVLELLDNTEKRIFDIAQRIFKKSSENMAVILTRVINETEHAANQPDGITGVPSGFTELDRETHGWQKTDLIVIAARPGMGKSAFVGSVARNVAIDFNIPVGIFSLEMSADQLVKRLLSNETEIELKKLRSGKMDQVDWVKLNHRITKLAKAPLYIDETASLTLFEFKAKARRMVYEQGVQLIILDYLQLMEADRDFQQGNREQEISRISRGLKAIAKDLNIPIIALSQLSRAVESRGGSKRPQLSDLRESGAIEQDADIVMFIHRPEYYNMTDPDRDVSNIADIIIAKNRSGNVTDVTLGFIGYLTKFVSMSDIVARRSGSVRDQSDGTMHKGGTDGKEEDIPY